MIKTNHIAILLDRSGSTAAIAPGMLKQFNQQAAFINSKSKETGQKTHLSFYTFATQADRPLLFEVPMDLVELKQLTSRDYTIEGMTAMYDSIGACIEDLSQFHKSTTGDHSFLIVVITDGQENQSRNFSSFSLKRLMDSKVASDMWSFVFLVPRNEKRGLQERLGISEGNIQEWEQSDRGVEIYGQVTTQGLSNYFSARTAGQRSVKSFFTTDLTSVRVSDVKKLVEVTPYFTRYQVGNKVEKIREAYEYRMCGGFAPYEIGCGFYELVKPEKIQGFKKVVLEQLNSGKLLSGPEARNILGLPDNGSEVLVHPGNHGSYKIYIQSTSVNRNLMPNTTLLYLTNKRVFDKIN